MDRKELAVLFASRIRKFAPLSADAKRYALRVSSGTSGSGPLFTLVGLRLDRLHNWLGVGNTLVCYGPRAARTYNLLATCLLGGRCLAFDGEDLKEHRVTFLAEFAPIRIVGFSTFILRAAPLIPHPTRLGVQFLNVSGELLNESMERSLCEYFPNALLRSQYSSSEAGAISTPSCGYLPRNHFHVQADTTIEVDSPDENGSGELLISRSSGGVSIVRYRIGDVGRLYACTCPCGATEALEILGRAGRDYIKLAGGLLRIEEFERVMAKYKGLIQDYRVDASTLVSRGSVLGKVSVRFYCAGARPTDALQREITENMTGIFVTPTRTLAELIVQGLFMPLEVAFVTQPFPQGHKESKLTYHA